MKTSKSSKEKSPSTNYKRIVTPRGNPNRSLPIKQMDWSKGEHFEIFTLLKNMSSGTTSTESSLTSLNA